MDSVVTTDGGPAQRLTVDESSASDSDLQWAYVLHPDGIEVIACSHARNGPVVAWDCDPLISFNDDPWSWCPGGRIPVAGPQITAHGLTAARPAPATPPPDRHPTR
jgi:hypothetical protein